MFSGVTLYCSIDENPEFQWQGGDGLSNIRGGFHTVHVAGISKNY